MAEGEEAAAAPDDPVARLPGAAIVRSRGFLPFRTRREEEHRLRPAFPGTAVVLGERTYEVVSETVQAEEVVYGLRPWPEGEVVRDRRVYGPRLVRAAQADRERVAFQARVRPYRFLLYPFVGLLPEAAQERWAERLGLYAVRATFVSGCGEAAVLLLAVWLAARSSDEGLRVALALAAPLLAGLALFGLGRAFAAAAFRETRGHLLAEAATAAARAVGEAFPSRDPTLVPLTREAFWQRLERPDRVTAEPDGALLVEGLLPHLTWRTGHHVRAGSDFWLVEALPPRPERGRLVFTYRLLPPPGRGADAPAPAAPSPLAYHDEVRAGIRREWDDLLGAFTWLVSLLPAEVQARAFAGRGGPAAARGAVAATAGVQWLFALYVLAQPVVASDPVGPWLRLVAAVLLLDGARRLLRSRQGRFAPTVLRAVLPSRILRPERLAYQAHRDAEREARLRLQG